MSNYQIKLKESLLFTDEMCNTRCKFCGERAISGYRHCGNHGRDTETFYTCTCKGALEYDSIKTELSIAEGVVRDIQYKIEKLIMSKVDIDKLKAAQRIKYEMKNYGVSLEDLN